MSSKLISLLNNISSDLNNQYGKYVLPDLIQNFTTHAKNFSDNCNEILSKSRDLKIGIIGSVKAGKSSFLNALIFGGEDLLPKAATPMTASLTKISYSEKNEAKIVFFSKNDWEEIKKISAEYDDSLQRLKDELIQKKRNLLSRKKVEKDNISLSEEEIKKLESSIPENTVACHQIVNNFKNKDDYEFLNTYLGQEKLCTFEDAKKDLYDYVGSNGKFTSIVKYTELKINNDLLKGIEIIDTPGLGDPLASRCMKTKDFLISCDVVFLLSSSSQFLTDQDMKLLLETLPENSIAQVLLIGSKFDSAILDFKNSQYSLSEAVKTLAVKNTDRALSQISNSVSSKFANEASKKLFGRLSDGLKYQLQKNKVAYFTSSILYSAARKKELGLTLTDDESHAISQLSKFEGMRSDPQFLKELSSIDRLKNNEFESLREKKHEIIEQRCSEIFEEQKFVFGALLDNIQLECEQHLHSLEFSDKEKILNNLKCYNESLTAMHRDIKSTFEVCANDTKRYFAELLLKIKSLSSNFSDVEVTQETRNVHHESTSGFLFWKKTRHWVETITDNIANLGTVDTSIRNYIISAEKTLASDIKFAVDTDKITDKIKNIAISYFSKNNVDFDPNDILGPMDVLLSSIKVPPFKLADPGIYSEILSEKFPSSRIENEEISKLLHAYQFVLNKIIEDITVKLQEEVTKISGNLVNCSLTFTDEMKKKLQAKAIQLETSLKDKETNITVVRKLIDNIAERKKEIISM